MVWLELPGLRETGLRTGLKLITWLPSWLELTARRNSCLTGLAWLTWLLCRSVIAVREKRNWRIGCWINVAAINWLRKLRTRSREGPADRRDWPIAWPRQYGCIYGLWSVGVSRI